MSRASAFERLTDLEPGKIYYYRLVASNEEGITYGEDATFTTESGSAP